jgi:hypothetical protein
VAGVCVREGVCRLQPNGCEAVAESGASLSLVLFQLLSPLPLLQRWDAAAAAAGGGAAAAV